VKILDCRAPAGTSIKIAIKEKVDLKKDINYFKGDCSLIDTTIHMYTGTTIAIILHAISYYYG